MSESISVKEVAAWLKDRDNFLILTHIRPDGDTLGCAGGLTHGLRELGKTVYVLKNTEVTERYARCVENCFAPEGFVPEHIIAVDTATPELLPGNAAEYINNISLCIDHHDSNTRYAQLLCCYSDYAACGEIIYDILAHLSTPERSLVTKETADCLYIAVSTDTGCFAYANTTANTHRIAALLIEHGASNGKINKALFRTKRRERILLEGMINSGIEFYHNDKVAIVTITRQMMMSSGASEDDIDDVASIPGSIDGVGMGITIRELSSETDCKISVRTLSPYNAGDFCKNFGGGGHKSAAGATIRKTVQEVKKDILNILKDYDFSL